MGRRDPGAGPARALLAGLLVVLAALGVAAVGAVRAEGRFDGRDAPGIGLSGTRLPVGWLVLGVLAAAVLLLPLVLARTGVAVRGSGPRPRRQAPLLIRLVVLFGTVGLLWLAVRAVLRRRGEAEQWSSDAGADPSATGAVDQHVSAVTVAVLAALTVAVVAAAVLLIRRARVAASADDGPPLPAAADEDLLARTATAGRAALFAPGDAREAVLACYAAMEEVLAAQGTPRGAAETPGELLTRVRAAGLAPLAAAELTELFTVARYSSRPMHEADRVAARAALERLEAATR